VKPRAQGGDETAEVQGPRGGGREAPRNRARNAHLRRLTREKPAA
jgi:hypothetical protein